jgi:hypothetical protein
MACLPSLIEIERVGPAGVQGVPGPAGPTGPTGAPGESGVATGPTGPGGYALLYDVLVPTESPVADIVLPISPGVYEFNLVNMQPTSNASLRMDISSNGGVSWATSGFQTSTHAFQWNLEGSSALTVTSSTTNFALSPTMSSSGLVSGTFNVYVTDQISITGMGHLNESTSRTLLYGGGRPTGTFNTNAVRLIYPGSNISGRVVVFKLV